MSKKHKPMLACSVTPTQLSELKYPVLVQPKYDGIRCTVTCEGALTRTGKPIPNKVLAERLSRCCCVGWDLELVAGKHDKDVFNRTQSIVMSHKHADTDTVNFLVFDLVSNETAQNRWQSLADGDIKCKRASVVPSVTCENSEQVEHWLARWCGEGYEGLMIRGVNSLYKAGRGTLKDLSLIKLKPREDAEAVVEGITQLFSKDGDPRPQVGALVCRMPDGKTFELGTGFTIAKREAWFKNPPIGYTVTYYYQGLGTNGRPRFPAFKSFREPE